MSFGPTLYDVQGGGLITLLENQGPILGDPEPCLRFAAGAYLTSGDLGNGEPGVGTGGPGFAFEFWFRPSSAPAVTQTVIRGPYAAAATPQWRFTYSNAALLSFDVYDNRDLYNTASTTLTRQGVWYHVFGETDGGSYIRIYVNNVLSSFAFGGAFVHGIDPTQTGSLDLRVAGGTGVTYDYAYLAFYGAPQGSTRVGAHYTAGTARGYPQQAASARVGAVLDTAESHAPRRIGASARSVTDLYLIGSAPLDAIRDAVAAETVNAGFFAGSDGALVFLGANHRASSPYDSAQATFGDGAGELPYLDVTIDYSEAFLFNHWSVTREGTSRFPGTEQVASDAPSISRYFKRSQTVGGLPVVADSDASDIATAMLAKYKDPMQRITALTFDTTDPSVAEALFRRELMDCIRVLRTVPGGGARIDQTLYIQKISVSGKNDRRPWTVSWNVSPL